MNASQRRGWWREEEVNKPRIRWMSIDFNWFPCHVTLRLTIFSNFPVCWHQNRPGCETWRHEGFHHAGAQVWVSRAQSRVVKLSLGTLKIHSGCAALALVPRNVNGIERWHFTSDALIKKTRSPRLGISASRPRENAAEGREKRFYDSSFVIDFCVYVFYGSSQADDSGRSFSLPPSSIRSILSSIFNLKCCLHHHYLN